MVPNRFTVVVDANVLFGALQRNILLSLAEAEFFRPRWSEEILEELHRSLAERIGPDAANKALKNICDAFPEAVVKEVVPVPSGLDLPDVDDHHVFGAAISVRAAQIVTQNIRHFPRKVLELYDIEPITVDAFLSNTIGLDHIAAVGAIRTMRSRFSLPTLDGTQLLGLMEKRGLVETASELADYVDLI